MKRLFSIVFVFIFFISTSFSQSSNSYDAFVVEKSGQGPNLILIPGATCSGEVWRETVEELNKSYTCHVITLAGYAGVKALDQSPILPQVEEQLFRYIKEEAAKPIVIGHSIGGFLALKLAISQQEELKKIIVVDALPFLVGANNPNMTEEMAKQYPVEPMIQQYQQMDDSSFYQMQSQVINSMLANKSYRAQVMDWSMKSDRKTMAYTMHEMMTEDLRDDIAEISIPVMVLGAYFPNSPFPKEQTQKLYADQYANIKKLDLRIADNAHHFIMYDDFEWMMKQVNEFLNNNSL